MNLFSLDTRLLSAIHQGISPIVKERPFVIFLISFNLLHIFKHGYGHSLILITILTALHTLLKLPSSISFERVLYVGFFCFSNIDLNLFGFSELKKWTSWEKLYMFINLHKHESFEDRQELNKIFYPEYLFWGFLGRRIVFACLSHKCEVCKFITSMKRIRNLFQCPI